MANWKKIFAGTLLAGAGAMMFIYFQRQAKLLYDSCIKFGGVKNIHASLTDFQATITLNYMNKSDLSIELTKQHYDIYFNGMLAITISSNVRTKIGSHQTAPLDLNIKFNPKDLLVAGLKNLDQIILDRDSIKIGIKGKFSAQAGIVTVNNISYDEEMTIGEMLHPTEPSAPC